MQKFTRSLTREVEVGGERVAVTLDDHGITMRPVGARRPPHVISWTHVVCVATMKSTAPSSEHVAEAVKALKHGGEKAPAPTGESPAAESSVAAPEPASAPAPHAATPPPAAPEMTTASAPQES